MLNEGSINVRLLVILGIIGLFGIVTIALAAATLGTVNKRLDTIDNKLSVLETNPTVMTTMSTTTSTSTTTTATTNIVGPSQNQSLATSINVTDVLKHLQELQIIANNSNNTRAINTIGFNRTLQYIKDTLRNETNLNITEDSFKVRDFALNTNPILISSIDGTIENYIYSSDAKKSDFLHVKYSNSSSVSTIHELNIIPNGGCKDTDWENSKPDRVALIKRGGDCAFRDRASQAAKYNATGILFYNNGASSDNMLPIEITLAQENVLPALFLSYRTGQNLADAIQNSSSNVTVQLGIDLKLLPDFPVGNICADTPTGDPTQTIVVGSHSDSVPAGPGINDNGSGSAANLGLAIALARLFQTSTYAKYKYRVRFCWWGAEEIGLLGSDFHVKQAKLATTVGERLQDYLVNLNYDMLGSPNYIFGIYDGRTANNATPPLALPGSNKMSALYRDWFQGQKLPWTDTDFSGRSDYGPFLAEGIVAGGLFSGGDDTKTQAERDYYDQLLGQGLGGIVGAIHDPCYHQACDSIQNINVFAYEKMVQAAAYVLEYLARQNDLITWLYPNGRPTRTHDQSSRQKYDSINEYFGMPYL